MELDGWMDGGVAVVSDREVRGLNPALGNCLFSTNK